MRVLVVDDDADVRHVVMRALVRDGHTVTSASSRGESASAIAAGIDLLVLDVALPDGSGLDLCRQLRVDASTVPILILTAKTNVESRVEGLDAGADDYLTKPFAVDELCARVRALGRRGPVSRAFVHDHENVRLDFSARVALNAGIEVPITAREWAILEFLANRVDAMSTREHILEAVWGENTPSASSSLEVLVARLRKKLGVGIIRTLRGQGYSLCGTREELAKN